MKKVIRNAAIVGLTISAANGAIAISGTVGTAFKGSDGLTNIPSGALAMLVVDTTSSSDSASNGFLANSTNGAISSSVNGLTTTSDPGVTALNASIALNGYFGGDKILSIASVGGSGSISSLFASASISGYTSKAFALIWFAKSASTLGSEGLANQYYGIIRGSDWVFPSTDSGAFTMSSTDAVPNDNYYSFSSTLTSGQISAPNGFFTGSGTAGDGTADVRSATFKIVPEPSAALLGALGVLGLLRRRRN